MEEFDWQKKGPLGDPEKVDKNALKIAMEVASKTIGFELASAKAMSNEEFAAWTIKQEKERKKWEAEHPELVAAHKKWEEKYNSKKPYILTSQERELVKEILHIPDDKTLDYYETYIYNDGEICVRSPQRAWNALAGREWSVNLQTKTSKCMCMS